ncbi:S9 family peptidase [Lewinella sp. W8]|uniref:S9 family peptidase n=1 Tax=Lewinella sp. W8 TaxID=2528208 RepID=UPI0010674F35|nr:S9 family peptidase [Lewinella sp. W8]MTB51707.1 prolyl oligopeptidase family serine peptidase [Lewinella sp. W8]
MNLRFAPLFFLLLFPLVLPAQNPITAETYQRAESQLFFNTSPLVDRMNVRANWVADDQLWYRTLAEKGAEYVHYDIGEKKRTTFDSPGKLNEMLPERDATPQYDRRTEILSPDESKVVFIRDWNLWLRHLDSGEEQQLTTDGVENYGYATDNAGWRQSDRPIVLWSPDSKKIATYQQDQRHVSDMHLVTTNVGAPTLKSWKYPLPEDEKIIQIERVVIDVEQRKLVRLDMPADDRRGTLCDDISCTGTFDDNQWINGGQQLVFVSSTRDHKVAQLRVADATTGKVRDILREEVATQYESGQGEINWHYLEGSDEVIWYSERDNWGHLYLYDAKTGQLKRQITRGDFVVTQLKHIDEEAGVLFFEANGREVGRNPYFSHLYRVDLSGKNLKLLTPEDGNHRIDFSPDYEYFVDNYSQPNVPPVSVLRDRKGNLMEVLERTDISRLTATFWKAPTPITVKSADDQYDLYGLMFTPSNLDPDQKYPVVNYIYPGPQGGSVGSWSFSTGRGDHQALAELGFVVVVIEGSCNPGRSKAFHDACYGDMAVNTLPDQVAGMEQLAKKYPYLDLERVGVWGHSGGGFATAAALFNYPDFYDVGISESGNHDNRNYEDDWGERYIGRMEDVDGVNNYERQANQLQAENLRGKLLLAHGGMDDNVPPYNTLLVVDALVKANKDFDLIIFPNARHGFGADTFYMMRRRWDYFVEHLKGMTPPREYKIEYRRDPRL